jgi:hypothetical protein
MASTNADQGSESGPSFGIVAYCDASVFVHRGTIQADVPVLISQSAWVIVSGPRIETKSTYPVFAVFDIPFDGCKYLHEPSVSLIRLDDTEAISAHGPILFSLTSLEFIMTNSNLTGGSFVGFLLFGSEPSHHRIDIVDSRISLCGDDMPAFWTSPRDKCDVILKGVSFEKSPGTLLRIGQPRAGPDRAENIWMSGELTPEHNEEFKAPHGKRITIAESDIAGDIDFRGTNSQTVFVRIIDHSSWAGAFVGHPLSSHAVVIVDKGSKWIVTGNSFVSGLWSDDQELKNIYSEGYTVWYDGCAFSNQYLHKKIFDLPGGGYAKPMDKPCPCDSKRDTEEYDACMEANGYGEVNGEPLAW